MSTGPFSKYMLNLSLTVESVYMSTGTFPKDIVGLRVDHGVCLHVYRVIFGGYIPFETAMRFVYMSTGLFSRIKLNLRLAMESLAAGKAACMSTC